MDNEETMKGTEWGQIKWWKIKADEGGWKEMKVNEVRWGWIKLDEGEWR